MKKQYVFYFLMSVVLLLAACGKDETDEAASTEAESTEEQTEEEVTEEETAEEETEEPTEEETEEVVAKSEEAEEVAEEVEDVPEEEETLGGDEAIAQKQIVEGFEVQHGDLNVSLTDGGAATGLMDEEMLWYFEDEGYAIGDEISFIMFEFTVENTVEEERSFYLDQGTIITSTGEQIDAEIWLAEGLQSEMLGAVTTTGFIPYVMQNNNVDELEWVDIILPNVSDGEFNTITEEQKIRVELE